MEDDNDDEPLIDLTFKVIDTSITNHSNSNANNTATTVETLLATFPCGLPSPIIRNNSNTNSHHSSGDDDSDSDNDQFVLLRNRKNKKRLLLIEDTQNELLYLDCHKPYRNDIGMPHSEQAIGMFDPTAAAAEASMNTNTNSIQQRRRRRNIVHIVNVSDSFVMKQLPCTHNHNLNAGAMDMDGGGAKTAEEKQQQFQVKHESLVNTFGSKFAVQNLRKQNVLRKTREATLASLQSGGDMTSKLLLDHKSDQNNDTNNDTNTNENRKRKHVDIEIETAETDVLKNTNKNKSVATVIIRTNLFEYSFSEAKYSIFEFPMNAKAQRKENIYNIRKIIPKSIWKLVQKKQSKILQSWNTIMHHSEDSNSADDSLEDDMMTNKKSKKKTKTKKSKKKPKTKERTVFLFTIRCLSNLTKIANIRLKTLWLNLLIFYDILVSMITTLNASNSQTFSLYDHCLTMDDCQLINSVFLEEYYHDTNDKHKKRKLNNHDFGVKLSNITNIPSFRSKLRMIGLLLIVSLNLAFWKIRIASVECIAQDLQLPVDKLLQIYHILGCDTTDDTFVDLKNSFQTVDESSVELDISLDWWPRDDIRSRLTL